MLNEALSLAKGTDDKKVGINFQMPKFQKDEFEALCKKNGVTMTAMFLAMAQVALNQDKGISTGNTIANNTAYLRKKINDIETHFESVPYQKRNGDFYFDESIIDAEEMQNLEERKSELRFLYKLLKEETK